MNGQNMMMTQLLRAVGVTPEQIEQAKTAIPQFVGGIQTKVNNLDATMTALATGVREIQEQQTVQNNRMERIEGMLLQLAAAQNPDAAGVGLATSTY